jgi:hypothetical protein
MKMKPHLIRLLLPVLALGLVSGCAAALAQSDTQSFDPLTGLKNALQDAGAPALTSAQETSINALLTAFRSAHQKLSPSTAVQTAQAAYEDAILSGNSGAAASQATILGSAQASDMVQRQSDAAVLAIGIINILKTESGQLPALITKFGSSGVVRLVLRLAGGPGGFGGPRPGGPPPDGMNFVRPPRY